MNRRALRLLPLVAAPALVAAIPQVAGEYRSFEFTEVGIYVVALLGLQVLAGYNGQISLGHGAFMAIGAYTTADRSSSTSTGRDVWTIPLAGLAAGIVGFICRHPGAAALGPLPRPCDLRAGGRDAVAPEEVLRPDRRHAGAALPRVGAVPGHGPQGHGDHLLATR